MISSKRYNKVFITLEGERGTKLAEKWTSGIYGQPFAKTAWDDIVVPFDFVKDVKSIKLSFTTDCGHIRTLIVKGILNSD